MSLRTVRTVTRRARRDLCRAALNFAKCGGTVAYLRQVLAAKGGEGR